LRSLGPRPAFKSRTLTSWEANIRLASQKFPPTGTRMSITVFPRSRFWFLCWPTLIQSKFDFFKIDWILSFCLRLGPQHLFLSITNNILLRTNYTLLIADMIWCIYKGWVIKTSPCTATFNDLLCFADMITSCVKKSIPIWLAFQFP
jgi:hypothetical protein